MSATVHRFATPGSVAEILNLVEKKQAKKILVLMWDENDECETAWTPMSLMEVLWSLRVLEVKIGGKPLDPGAIYRLATNEYMMAGGDGYAALTKEKPVLDASGGPLMANVVMDYIAARGSVSPVVEGRIAEQK